MQETLVIYSIGIPYLAVYMHLVLKKPDAINLAIKTGALVFARGAPEMSDSGYDRAQTQVAKASIGCGVTVIFSGSRSISK